MVAASTERQNTERTWSRPLSLAVYGLAALLLWGARGRDAALLFLLTQAFVLPFIWFPDFFGEWLGAFPMPGAGGYNARIVDRESPAWLVAVFGWLILLGAFAVSYFGA